MHRVVSKRCRLVSNISNIGCEKTRVASFWFQIYLPSLLAKATWDSGLHILTAPWNFFQEMDGHAMDISMNPDHLFSAPQLVEKLESIARGYGGPVVNFPPELG